MRKYAVVQNNIVIEVLQLDEAGVAHEASYHDLVIDIQDQTPEPEIGWILDGNKLVSANASMTDDQKDMFQQSAQRKYGLTLLPTAVDKIGARNLKLAREGTPVDIVALSTQMTSIKLLLEGGALKTARAVCVAIKPSFPNHADILQEVVDLITNFLTNNNWN